MADYPVTQGTHGPIYHICPGLRVNLNDDGNWELMLRTTDKRKRSSFGKGEEAFKKAIKAGELLALKLGLLQVEHDKERLLSEVAAEWLNLNRQRWSGTTHERYSQVVRDYINPKLGFLPLSRINRAKVREALTETAKIRAAKSVELVHATLSGIFNEAIDLGYTNENPSAGMLKKILPPKRKRNLTKPDPFSLKDRDLMLEAAYKHLPGSYPLILETIAFTGMRLGECLAMRREHLDLTNNQYFICESIRRDVIGSPKTGDRLIDLPEYLTKKLGAHITRMREEALAGAAFTDFLFPGIQQNAVRLMLKRACYAAKLRSRSPHDLRHTYASSLLMAHYSPVYVQKQLGHHSISMTCDVYGHWIPGEGKKNLDETLAGQPVSRRPALEVVDKKIPLVAASGTKSGTIY